MKPFKNNCIKITLPLTGKILTKLEQSGKYNRILSDLHSSDKSVCCLDAHCELTVIFNLKRHKTHFVFHTFCANWGGETDCCSAYADFDGDTAEYLKAEALRTIGTALPKLSDCKHPKA